MDTETRPTNSLIRLLRSPRKTGQVLVVFAISLLALLFFIGLALDAGIVYVNYGQLKRAVDSGSVAAANNFKRGGTAEQMYAGVLEVMKLQNVNIDPSVLHLIVTTCDMNKNGWQDDDPRDPQVPPVDPLPTDFAPLCPITDPNNINSLSARKLVYVEAQQRTPLYFLSLLGIPSINLKTFSVAEAASVDLVLVIDTSESMGNKSVSYNNSNRTDYDPKLCNSYWDITVTPHVFHESTCQPLKQAIDAAENLVDTLYEGYDNISVITFDTVAHDPTVEPLKSFHLTSLVGGNKGTVVQKIKEIQLHDDAPYYNLTQNKMYVDWYLHDQNDNPSPVNPTNIEDRDGNGQDADPGKPCWVDASGNPRTPDPEELNTHMVINHPEDPGNGGLCDFANKNDAYDWNFNGTYDDPADSDLGAAWLASSGNSNFSLVSTCTGCAIRLASNELKKNGRPGAVWVVVLLSDGGVNMSDTYATLGGATQDPVIIPASYPIGFCTQRFWSKIPCWDGRSQDKITYPDNPYRKRYCLDKAAPAVAPATPLPDSATCPPGSIWEVRDPNNSNYSVFDYALDMVDAAALRATINAANPLDPRYNKNEPLGNDIAIYTVGLSSDVQKGEPLLRYMAAVGDDGDRVTDECLDKVTGTVLPPLHSCGQYYYAQTGNDLDPIFNSIASRIYTKITH